MYNDDNYDDDDHDSNNNNDNNNCNNYYNKLLTFLTFKCEKRAVVFTQVSKMLCIHFGFYYYYFALLCLAYFFISSNLGKQFIVFSSLLYPPHPFYFAFIHSFFVKQVLSFLLLY